MTAVPDRCREMTDRRFAAVALPALEEADMSTLADREADIGLKGSFQSEA